MRRAGAVKERLHIWSRRCAMEVGDAPCLFHSTVSHNHDLVRKPRRLGQVVRHEERRESQLGARMLERLVRFAAGYRVERAERFIEQDNLLPRCEGASESDALPLSAGEFRRKAVSKAIRVESDATQRLVGCFIG